MASIPALNDEFFLFNDVVYRFVHVDHPANIRLHALVMQLGPTDANHPGNTSLSLHPLWSEEAGGIVLFEGLRRDGNTRTFLTASQVQNLRDAAARSPQAPRSELVQTSDLADVKRAGEAAASPASAQQHSLVLVPAGAQLPVSAQSEQLTGPTVPADAAPSHSASHANGDPLAFEPRVLSYTIGGPGRRDLVQAPRQVVFRTFAELVTLRPFNRISVRTPDSSVYPQAAAPVVAPAVKKRPLQHDEQFEESRQLLQWARTCYTSPVGTWMAVDLEASELVPDVVTEIGIAVFPAPSDAPAYYHLALPAPVVDGDSSPAGPPPAPIPFAHGSTRHVTREEGILFLQTFVAKARTCGPLFVVFHDDRLETRLLFQKAAILPGSQSDHHHSTVPADCVTYFDTQSLFAGLTTTHSTVDRRIGLTKLLSALRVPFDVSEWHNAGNDAKWTLDCLIALLTKPASDVSCTCGKCL